jgi:hypothetical protein
MEEYIELHNCLQDLFDLYFESESHVYWEIFYKYMSEKNLSYAKLGVLYHYSTTKIRNIVHLVKDFLDDLMEKFDYKDYPLSVLFDKQCIMLNVFLRGYYSLPLTELKLFHEAVCLYQNFFPLRIPKSHILACGRQYANVDRREKVCRNLQNLKIYTEEGTIKIFKKFENDKDGMSFEFTEQALDYIDISQYIMRLFEKDRV